MSIDLQDVAVKQILDLADGDTEQALALVDMLENQQRQDRYVCYWEPYPEQIKFWDQLTPEQDTWLILGGTGSGKTETLGFIMAAWALGKSYFKGYPAEKWVNKLPIPETPNNIRGVGLNADMLRDPMWEKLTGIAEHGSFFPASEIEAKNNHQFTAAFKNGSKFHGKSAAVDDPKTHGGATLALVGIDEECHYEIFRENRFRIRKGGKILVTATPLDDVGTTSHPWIYDLIELWKAGDPTIGVIYMHRQKNPYLTDEDKRKFAARVKGAPDEQARLYGIPTRRSGLYYPMWKAEAPLWVPAQDLPPGGFRAVVIDPAATGPVGALWMDFDSQGNMTIYREYKEKNLTASQHCQNILVENRGDPIDLWLMDPWMGRQRQTEDHRTVLQVWRDNGLPRLRLADADYEMALQESREYVGAAWDHTSPHPRVTVFDHLEKFKAEIERYIVDSVTQGAKKGETRDKPRKGNDHLLNCYQYCCGMRLRARGGGVVKLVDSEFRSYT